MLGYACGFVGRYFSHCLLLLLFVYPAFSSGVTACYVGVPEANISDLWSRLFIGFDSLLHSYWLVVVLVTINC